MSPPLTMPVPSCVEAAWTGSGEREYSSAGPELAQLVRTSGGNQRRRGPLQRAPADEEHLTWSFATLSLTLAVHADVGTTQQPVEISAQIRPP